jgi:hypothetical protein
MQMEKMTPTQAQQALAALLDESDTSGAARRDHMFGLLDGMLCPCANSNEQVQIAYFGRKDGCLTLFRFGRATNSPFIWSSHYTAPSEPGGM